MDRKNKRYLPHEISTRIGAVKLYRLTHDIDFVLRRYHVSKASLMRWNRRYDGTKKSLADRSHRPHSAHPNAHTDLEIKWIRDYCRRNPSISMCELYGKLKREKGYSRHFISLYRVLCRLGYRLKSDCSTKKRKTKNYDTPFQKGLKWQIDVKYIPSACYVGELPDKFYQFTAIDECTRERFIYPYREQSGYTASDFLKRAVRFFGYAPQIVQTDNGSEFNNIVCTDRVHAFDIACSALGIVHKKIRPHTPRHNGKVERSHRNDQRRFYDWMTFFSYDDLRAQMAAYLRRSNRIPMQILGWQSPIEFRKEIETFEIWFKSALA